jgi:hypothetical protein
MFSCICRPWCLDSFVVGPVAQKDGAEEVCNV